MKSLITEETLKHIQKTLDFIKASVTEIQLIIDDSYINAKEFDQFTINLTSTDSFIFQLSIFVLSAIIGYFVVWNVSPALHTPLMSVTNAISSVIIIGSLIGVTSEISNTASLFGFIGLILASINIFGGFLVTQRMLSMYCKRK